MVDEKIIREINSRWPELYPAAKETSKGKPAIICPLCGHGANGDGIVENPHSGAPHQLKCFGCDFSGDVIALYRQQTGKDFRSSVDDLAQRLNIKTGNQSTTAHKQSAASGELNKLPAEPKNAVQKPAAATQNEPDYGRYYLDCAARLKTSTAALEYLAGRGISEATAARYGIGFDPESDPANNPGGAGRSLYPVPRIIIPTSPEHYVGRAIVKDCTRPKMNPKGAKPGIFNSHVLEAVDDHENVFLVEGAFDALAIMEAGGQAVALNSTSQAGAFVDHQKQLPTAKTVIICLDNDAAGQRATETLCSGLASIGIKYAVANVSGEYKDPDEFLQNDREGFIEAVRREERRAQRPDNVADFIDCEFIKELEKTKAAPKIKTGFDELDEKAGRINAGLYVLAAISSLGKTTFMHQCADQIAAAGNDVIYFSLEQSRTELVSKSVARITAQPDITKGVSSLAIRNGYLPRPVVQAVTEYQKRVGQRFSICEGNFKCTASFIEQYAKGYITRTGARPVVFVDYLQIIQPEPGARQTTQEVITDTITRLKRMSRDLDIPVFVISSVNRANYATPISFESLKESGSIEYSADVVWGLQLHCLQEEIFSTDAKAVAKRNRIEEAKAENPRQIDLKCLKNRFGVSNFTVPFFYYPANELFTAAPAEHQQRKAGR